MPIALQACFSALLVLSFKFVVVSGGFPQGIVNALGPIYSLL